MYSSKQPSWDNGLAELLGYTARLQFIQQLGTPLTDVAMYNKPSATDCRLPTIYGSTDLTDGGWTYSYLSSENFNLPHANANQGILAPDGPAWKAVVIESKQNLSLDAISHLKTFASAGVPIIFSGGKPGHYTSGNDASEAAFSTELDSLLSMSNSYQVASGAVASKLASIGIKPRVKYAANGTWYTALRTDAASKTDYIFVLNDIPSATVGQIMFESGKTPYFLDAWTGEKVPALSYNSSSGTTNVQLSLAGQQGILVAFQDPTTSDPACHLSSINANLLGSSYSQSTKSVRLQVASAGSVTTSSGKTQSFNSSNVALPIELNNWNLIAEHWERPSDIHAVEVAAVKRNTTHQLDSLTSWLNIPELASVSGLGYYTSTFTRPAGVSGAYISLPLMQHGARVYINGAQIPHFDFLGALQDITPFLKDGQNEVRVVVPTTMWNYLKTLIDTIWTPGIDRGIMATYPVRDNGLIGTVTVVPFQEVEVAC